MRVLLGQRPRFGRIARATGGGQLSGQAQIPAHIQAASAGQWTPIGSNTLSSAGYDYTNWSVPSYSTNLQGIMAGWSGAWYDSSAHKLYVHGGGDNDYDGNEVYAFDVPSNTWSRLDNPSPYNDVQADHPTGVYPDGGPIPIHTYNSFLGHGGYLYRLCRSGSWLNHVWRYDIAAAQQLTPGAQKTYWSQRAALVLTGDNSTAAAWMQDEGVFFVAGATSGGWLQFSRYNPTTDSWGTVYEPGIAVMGTDRALAYRPSARQALLWRSATAGVPVVIDAAANTAATQTLSGATPPSSCSVEYDSWRDLFWLYTDAQTDRRTLFTVSPATWQVVQVSPSGTTPSASSNSGGTFGRFRYMQEYDVFCMVNLVSGNVWVYKPSDWRFA